MDRERRRAGRLRVLVCGDRHWTDAFAIERELKFLRSLYAPMMFVILHGAAPGADTLAGTIATRLGMRVRAYPAHWQHTVACPADCKKVVGRAAGPIRNRYMLRWGRPDLVLAFHDDITGKSKGTKDMVGIARRQGIMTRVFGHRDPSSPDRVVLYKEA